MRSVDVGRGSSRSRRRSSSRFDEVCAARASVSFRSTNAVSKLRLLGSASTCSSRPSEASPRRPAELVPKRRRSSTAFHEGLESADRDRQRVSRWRTRRRAPRSSDGTSVVPSLSRNRARAIFDGQLSGAIRAGEGRAEFAVQFKLLGQNVVSALSSGKDARRRVRRAARARSCCSSRSSRARFGEFADRIRGRKSLLDKREEVLSAVATKPAGHRRGAAAARAELRARGRAHFVRYRAASAELHAGRRAQRFLRRRIRWRGKAEELPRSVAGARRLRARRRARVEAEVRQADRAARATRQDGALRRRREHDPLRDSIASQRQHATARAHHRRARGSAVQAI